jgi:acetate kinase
VNGSTRRVLSINCGSSSVKTAAFTVSDGHVEQTGLVTVSGIGGDATLRVVRGDEAREEKRAIVSPQDAVRIAFDELQRGKERPAAVGHRIVHGGDRSAPALIDSDLLAELRRLTPLAPLHQQVGLQAVSLIEELLPATPQVACFDTAFHHTMPLVAKRLPLPTPLFDAGLRRYGFHGLSCEHVVHTLGEPRLGRAVVAHLGSGASLTALRHGRSVDTSMSLTPTGGVMMSTRSGDIDPSVLVYLLQYEHYDAAGLQELIEHESGLLGVSQASGDMQTLLGKHDHDPAVALAIELFCRSVSKQVGAFAAVLGGVETLVFTGGIGEQAATIRRIVCEPLAHLGIRLDEERNRQSLSTISTTASPCAVRIVATDEQAVIARHTAAVVFG